jgi:hypothetical protein
MENIIIIFSIKKYARNVSQRIFLLITLNKNTTWRLRQEQLTLTLPKATLPHLALAVPFLVPVAVTSELVVDSLNPPHY